MGVSDLNVALVLVGPMGAPDAHGFPSGGGVGPFGAGPWAPWGGAWPPWAQGREPPLGGPRGPTAMGPWTL